MECWVNPFKTHTYIHLCHVPPFHWFLPSPFPSRSLVGERVHWRYFGWCCRRDGPRCYLCTMYIDALFFSILPSLASLSPPTSSIIPLFPYPPPPTFSHALSISPFPTSHFPLSPLFPLPSPPLFPPSLHPIHHLLGLFLELHLT